MKTIEEQLLESIERRHAEIGKQSNIKSTPVENDIDSTEDNNDMPVSEIPSYMYTDTEAVGYPDIQTQNDIYNLSLAGVIPLTGDYSILDIGCGRGDLYDHLRRNLPLLDIKYTGYELNPLLAKIGTEKNILPTEKASCEILNDDFIDINTDDLKVDTVFMIGSMNVDYGWNMKNWEYLELVLNKSMKIAQRHIVFILLHDTGGQDGYVSFPIPNLSDLILKFNYPFKIEYGDIPGVYKLTINMEPIFITQ